MIVNEIAKLVNLRPAAVELLLVAELCEPLLVAVDGRRRPDIPVSSLPPVVQVKRCA